MSSWQEIAAAHKNSDCRSILLTIGAVAGSTPRETGTRMLVTAKDSVGTIGGGRLEYIAINQARDLLNSAETPHPQLIHLPLGPELAQCCGGHVDVFLCPLSEDDLPWIDAILAAQMNNTPSVLLTHWDAATVTRSIIDSPQALETINEDLSQGMAACLHQSHPVLVPHQEKEENFILIEPVKEARLHLTLFGAGHVGKAIVHALAPLPCTIDWIDEREDMFQDASPNNVRQIIPTSPAHHVDDAPAGSFYLVMSHSHQLDLEICTCILARDDYAYLGLIGSRTKKQKFSKRLKLRGISENQLSRLVCPIGLEHLNGKHPAEIAISVTAEILGVLQAIEQAETRLPEEKAVLTKFE